MNFPVINTIDDVLWAIDGQNEFKVVNHGLYSVVCYAVQTPDTFPEVVDERTSILRECRGLIFCNKTGKILSRPTHKFFNVNEREETQSHAINILKEHIIMDKLDGSMVRPFRTHDGVLRVATKRGETDVSDLAVPFFEQDNYRNMAEWCINNNYTACFELMTPHNRIVIDYGNESNLTLLLIRHNITGKYLDY